jgi:hypothetical protein
MQSKLIINPGKIEHRRDLADQMIVRNRFIQIERIEQLPLILLEPPPHRPTAPAVPVN